MIHVTRYFAALTVLLVLFCTYAVAVAPWFEPPPIVIAPHGELPPPAALIPSASLGELAQLFPPGHWVHLSPPMIVKTEQCTLLIEDYKMLPDGDLQLTKCAMIFRAAAPKTPTADGTPPAPGRPIVLEAPDGAKLTFDKPLDPMRAEFGRLEKGTLAGEIRIFSPPSMPGARDALECSTRAVWLDRQSIRTSNKVEFTYGESSGSGRILEIALRGDQAEPAKKSRSRIGGLHTITLEHLDFLRIASEGRGILNNATPSDSPAAESQNAPLEVTCQGRFTFDMVKQLARFEKQVEVRRLLPNGPPDQLLCEELLLAFAPRKAATDAAASASDPLAGRLSRIIASGAPAVLKAPSSGALATAAYMEYSLADRYVTLKSDRQKEVPQVSLQQFEQHFVAPELHYQMPEHGRLGRLRATGPGELRMADVSGGERQVITARWEKELQVQPQERNHVISLLDRASVTLDPLGRFDGNELHLWIQEVAVPSAEPSATVPNSGNSSAKTTIIPDRLLAVGDVRVVSPQLDVDAGRLEAWFINLPAEPKPIEPLAPPRLIREPVQPAAFTSDSTPQATIRNVVRQPTLQKFHVGGAKIQLQAVVRGRAFELESLNIDGQAAIDETRTPEPGQDPIRLRGDLFELRQGTTPAATAHVRGLPAEVSGRGLSLAGSQIQLLRGKNQLLIDGPGEATFPAPVRESENPAGPSAGATGGLSTGATGGLMPLFNSAGAAPPSGQRRPPAPPQRMKIIWEQGLVFDGLTARFVGNVQMRSNTQTALAPVLEATLSERLDFQATGGQPRAELANVLLDGQTIGIYVENLGYDEWGHQVSREQLKARTLAVDCLAGRMHVAGPGWFSTVRRGNAAMPGAPSGGTSSFQPVSSNNPTMNQESLNSIHVAFEREIVGDLNRREIEFRQQVLTTYSPASDFSDVIAADPIGKLGPRMVLMQSDKLTITEFIIPPVRWFELRATGHTKVRGEKIEVDAPIVGYSSDKEVLTIHGDGRADAKAWFHKTSGDDPVRYEGQLLKYNLRTGGLQTDVVKNFHFPLSPNIKLPAPSLPVPIK